eukprot:s2395_g13.t2
MKELPWRGRHHARAKAAFRWTLASLLFILGYNGDRPAACLVWLAASAAGVPAGNQAVAEGLHKVRPQKQCKQRWTWDRWISERIMCRSCWRKPPLCPPTSGGISLDVCSPTRQREVKKLLSIPNLVAIETVDSSSLADRIASAAQAAGRGEGGIDPLDLFIQVDTSNEETKGLVHGFEV